MAAFYSVEVMDLLIPCANTLRTKCCLAVNTIRVFDTDLHIGLVLVY
jgi:hypothetical protein